MIWAAVIYILRKSLSMKMPLLPDSVSIYKMRQPLSDNKNRYNVETSVIGRNLVALGTGLWKRIWLLHY